MKTNTTLVLIFILVFLSFGGLVYPVYSASIDGIINENKNSIVQLIDKEKSTKIKGFGTIISPDGLILTTTRALNGNDILVRTSDLRYHKIEKVIFSQTEDNFAIIKINKADDYPSVDYSSKVNVKLGDKVINIKSFSNGDYKAASSVVGKLIGSAGSNARIMVLVNSENIQPSLEGSPVFSKKGQLIGFISLVSGRNFNKVAYSPLLEDFKDVLSKYVKENESQAVEPKIRKIRYNENIAVVEKKKKDKKARNNKKKKKPLFSFFSRHKKEEKKKVSKATTEPKQVEPQKKKRVSKAKAEPKQVDTSKKKNRTWSSKPDEKLSSAYALSRKAYQKKVYPSNNFNISLTGLWFDTATGHSLYIVQNGSTIELKRSQDRIYDDSLEKMAGQFKKEGNKYVGEIVLYFNCETKYCNVKEPAELLYWNEDKIELKVKSGDGYSCNYCPRTDQADWKDRMWLKKANR